MLAGTSRASACALPGAVAQIVFTPEGRHLATANWNGTIYLLRLAKARPQRRRVNAPTRCSRRNRDRAQTLRCAVFRDTPMGAQPGSSWRKKVKNRDRFGALAG
jgi:hypothetical protein